MGKPLHVSMDLVLVFKIPQGEWESKVFSDFYFVVFLLAKILRVTLMTTIRFRHSVRQHEKYFGEVNTLHFVVKTTRITVSDSQLFEVRFPQFSILYRR